MKRALMALALLVGVSAAANCTDDESTLKTLRVNGYKNVILTGYAVFACGSDSSEPQTCTGFKATAPNGERVEGAVSCGLMGCKGCTIRLD